MTMTTIPRRRLLKAGVGAAALASLYGCASMGRTGGHVVVVGGGFGGATAAKYIRMWSEGAIRVTLVERNPRFISCPMSNLVLAGTQQMNDITLGYDQLRSRWGVELVQGDVVALDAVQRSLRLADGTRLSYDRLVLSPGVDFMFDQLPGLNNPAAQAKVLHAWKAGPQTTALRAQLQAMPDGGVYALAIPEAPYRCPPGPYERACLVAHYFKQHKPRSKVVILDANSDVQSKKGLFMKAWADLYPNIIEYRNDSELRDVDAETHTAVLASGRFKADVLNVIPPHRAGNLAVQSGLKLVDKQWVDVEWLSMESVNTPGVHVLGDAIYPVAGMPKSGHMANQHAKLAAAAIVNIQAGRAPNPAPVAMNTCYSFVDERTAIHVAAVFQFDPATKQLAAVKGSGGVSSARNEIESRYATGWARNIWADMLA
jgi:sulfite dehydrogenase